MTKKSTSLLPYWAGISFRSADYGRDALRLCELVTHRIPKDRVANRQRKGISSCRAREDEGIVSEEMELELPQGPSGQLESPSSLSLPFRGRSAVPCSFSPTPTQPLEPPHPLESTLQHESDEPFTTLTPAAPEATEEQDRREILSPKCKKCDGNRCVVTGKVKDVDAAPTYPYALHARSGEQAEADFWIQLESF
jgi:hypothetical protein